MKLIKIYFAAAILPIMSMAANAQTTPSIATVVATCGTPPTTYTAGQQKPVTQNTGGLVCTGATVTPSGTQNVTGTGTAGSPAAGVITVQGISGGTPQNVSEAPTAAAANAIVSVVSQGASTLQGKGSAGNLYTVYATTTADSWLMVFNSTTAPTNGGTTAGTASGNMQDCVKVPSGTSVSIGGLPIPERFSTGIYFALSSTACATLTLATTGLIHALAQ